MKCTIATSTGPRTVDADTVADAPGLIVHPAPPWDSGCPWLGGDGWTVTHHESGRSVVYTASREAAHRAAVALNVGGLNWSQPAHAVRADERYMGAVRALLNAGWGDVVA